MHNKYSFYLVYKAFKPNATDAEFEADWAEYETGLENHQKNCEGC